MPKLSTAELGKLFQPVYDKPWKNRLVLIVGAVATAIAILTIGGILCTRADAVRPGWAKLALTFWAVFPPLCFWAEYWLLWRHDECATIPRELERFKLAQELGRNIWIAFVVLLGAFYFKV